jgi:hypothetical protein
VVSRRAVIRGGLASLAGVMMSRLVPGCGSQNRIVPADAGAPDAPEPLGFPLRNPPAPALRALIDRIGPLGPEDANGVRVAEGFSSRVIGRAGQVVGPSAYRWHAFPDGGATFATEDGGWIYVSNSELPASGGVGAVRFDAAGEIRAAYRILERSNINCAGGKTPWHTWLSCEEIDGGRVFECDPWGEAPPLDRPALGRFQHEAVAVDPARQHLYLTEDVSDGRLYRFSPDRLTRAGHPDLSTGRLEVAVVAADRSVSWRTVPDPLYAAGVPTRNQVPESTPFDGGEGIWYHDDVVYFSTKGDVRVWAYDVVASRLSVLHDGRAAPTILNGVDNLTVTCCGDVLVAEDGGDMQIVAILPDGELKALVQVPGHTSSEITGPAFDPSGTRLYFSSQRGESLGVTYEVRGPFHEPA